MQKNSVISITESAAMVALATILSLIQVVSLPFGGSVTAASMLPIILIAYRKRRWGIPTALVYAVLQLFLGLSNLKYAVSFGAVVAIIMLDYIVAFAVLGLAGIFKNKMGSQSAELLSGTLLVSVLRYICHVISGCTVWAGVSVPSADGLIYSLLYNAAYMIPETVVTLAVAWYLSYIVDFRADKLAFHTIQSKKPDALKYIGVLVLIIGVVADFLYLFQKMQTPDGFDITALKEMNLYWFLGILAGSAIVFFVLGGISKILSQKSK